MIEAFEWVIKTYGQEMVCRKEDGTEAGRGMAIVQPMTQADWQYTAGALGSYSQDKFLGLAEPGLPMDKVGWDPSHHFQTPCHAQRKKRAPPCGLTRRTPALPPGLPP